MLCIWASYCMQVLPWKWFFDGIVSNFVWRIRFWVIYNSNSLDGLVLFLYSFSLKPSFHMIAHDRRIAGITEAKDRSRSRTIAWSLKRVPYNRCRSLAVFSVIRRSLAIIWKLGLRITTLTCFTILKFFLEGIRFHKSKLSSLLLLSSWIWFTWISFVNCSCLIYFPTL